MRKLLLPEWLKISKYSVFWILLGLYVLAVICINVIVFQLEGNVSTQTGGNIQLDLFAAPYLWNTTGWLEGFALILPGFLMIILVTNEFSFKTLRQNIIEGLSREQTIASKWLLLLFLAIGCWLIYFIVTLVIGISHNASGTLFDGFAFAGYTFLKILLALSVAFIFAIWIKRSGLAIALFLVYYLFIEGIIGYLLDKILFGLGDFLPLSCGSMLVPNPFEKYLIGSSIGMRSDYWFVLAGAAWIILFILLSVRYIRRTDL